MRYIFSCMKLHFINIRCSKLICLRRTVVNSRINVVRGFCSLKPINPSAQISSVFNIRKLNHLVNAQEQLEDNGKQMCVSDSEFLSITNGDPVKEKKLKILFLEAEVFRQNGVKVPDQISKEQWEELLELSSRSKRKKYMVYLFGIEKRKQNKKQKKEESRHQREGSSSLPKENEDGQITYGLGSNSMFLRVYDATITKFHNSRLIQAMQFGQKLVLDCGYDSYMNKQEAKNCAKQMMLMFSYNRYHDNPFDLHFCNTDKGSITMRHLTKFIPTLHDFDFPLNLTERSYLDIFPKENLVYLTPHCREVMREFDHEAVYIIGGMVDKTNSEPLSLAKAKREGLKMAKLPLDEYLLWGNGGSKSLTLNQMISILLEIRESNDWNKALLHVPRRKVISPNDDTDIQQRGFDRKQFRRLRMFNYIN